MIQVVCAQCGLRILVPSTVQGRKGICFGCGSPITAPNVDLDQVLNLKFAEGERISDRYIIKRPIGKGGMSMVYHAVDELVGEDVALKFMRPRLLRTPKGQKMFIREAQVVRRLRHENIIAVHDVGATSEGILYLSMELLSGRSLRELIRTHRTNRKLISVRLAVSFMSQVLDALDYAHRTVVHRDIKPENVMLLPGERVKVLDFGLAQAVRAEAEEPEDDPAGDDTKKRRIIGTLAYTSPEQRRHQSVDFRTDIYSAGLVFRELLTLHTPMDGPVTVPDVRTDVAPSIIRVLETAIKEDREARYQSAGAFRRALQEAYADSYKKVAVVDTTRTSGKEVSTENMVHLEGGSFLMGNQNVSEESPEFEVHVKPFYIDIYPVTVELYGKFLEATGHPEPKFWNNPEFNGPSQPVIGITWNDAMAYAAWAGKQLPTEEQWEFAARGRENRKYPWGNLEPDPTRCNIADYLGMPSIVTMHEAGHTPEGVYDMAGNVYEWTVAPFVAYSPNGNKTKSDSSPRRVVRGGSWHSPVEDARTTHRKGLFPESQLATVGFRCVLPARVAQRKNGDD